MGKYLIILLLIPTLSFGQGYANFGNTNPLDTARTRNHLLVEGQIRLQGYNSLDTTFLLKLPGSRVVNYTLANLLTRVAASAPTPTLQQVLTSGSTLTQDNDINLNSFRLRIYDGRLESDSAKIGILRLDAIAEYTNTFTTFSGNQIPSADWINELVTQSYFDTTMSTTVMGLTSPRFVRDVVSINYRGLTYNSDYFTQVGTNLTFIGLTFYNGQKLTFNLR